MTKPVTLAAGSSLTAQANYDIEVDWDYAYLVISTDGGATWTPYRPISRQPRTQWAELWLWHYRRLGGWVDLTADLSAYTGNVLLGFRYWTDANTGGFGFMVDDLNITGYPTDGAETAAGWTYTPTTGFHVTNGIEGKLFNHYYVAEFRQYRGYDASLKTAYNFGFLNNPELETWSNGTRYQDGLLISYWDTSQANNNTSQHPGTGLLLPIDAHPNILRNADGGAVSNRIQTFDSTFSLEPTDKVTLHFNSVPVTSQARKAVALFNDLKQYYNIARPTMGVINPNTGTIIEIRSYSALDNFMQVQVRPAK